MKMYKVKFAVQQFLHSWVYPLTLGAAFGIAIAFALAQGL